MIRAQRHFVLVDFKGAAGIDRTGTMILRGLEPGSVFGEMALDLGSSRTASVVVNTASVVNRLSGDSLRRREEEDSQLVMAVHKLLAKLMATKLRQTNAWLSHLA